MANADFTFNITANSQTGSIELVKQRISSLGIESASASV
jgi:hypothetical protein